MTNAQEFLSVVGITEQPVASQDPRTIPASEIVFDPADLKGFDLNSPDSRRSAADHLFAKYKSKDSDRNKLLWRLITEFMGRERLAAKTDGLVKAKVKASREQRDLAALLASQGITTDQLMSFIQTVKAESGE